MNVKGVSIRFTEEMLQKVAYIAEYEGRSINSHMLVLARQDIEKFEKTHGEISGELTPSLNVKPPRNIKK